MADIFDEVQNDIFDEVSQQTAVKPSTQQPAQTQLNSTEQRIQNRQSVLQSLITNPATMKHPLGAVLRTLGAAQELYQGIPASIALDLQQGKPQNIVPNLGKVVTGQRPVEYGDVFKGAGLPEPLAAGAGLYSDVMLSPGGAEGTIALGKGIKALPKAVNGLGTNAVGMLKKLIGFENALERSTTAKTGLETLRKTIGQAKSLVIEEVKDVPVKLKTLGENLPEIAIKSIKDPAYAVEMLPDGSIKPTIGNLDKIKEALGDLIGQKPMAWKESSKAAKDIIKSTYFKIRDVMVDAAKDAGKDLKTPLDEYHKFMVNYRKINPALIDKNGEIVANKLKTAFKWTAEPAYKKAWEEVSKASPEIKSVMNSMKKRELLKNLLKTTGVGIAGIEGSKRLVTGNW